MPAPFGSPAGMAPPLPSGPYSAADLLSVDFENGTYGALTDWGGVNPPSPTAPRTLTIDAVAPITGTKSLKYTLPANPGPGDYGTQCRATLAPTRDRVYTAFDILLSAAYDGTQKLHIFEDNSSGNQYGGLYFEGGRLSAFINDNPTGFTAILREIGGLVGRRTTIELDHWRNGDPSGWPSMAFRIDGKPIYGGLARAPSYWDGNGRLQAGVRLYATKIQTVGFGELQNGTPPSTVATTVWLDRCRISSLGWMGP